MVSAINSALSGIAAASQRLNVTANNVANAQSTQTLNADGSVINSPYVPQQVVQVSLPGGGVETRTQAVNPASQSVYDPGNVAADSNGVAQYPNVDTANELVQGKLALYDAQGSINVLKVQDKLFKSVLNIVS